ncbi:cell cycle checkpoint control protein RAD9A-like isoform X2 [Tubulanus polymorphus]|uniref:cell cycle checkpoint control protein RAD9A-like isoform X2 n=1 Tax=Tubulanus polymorphus TaxID=672921 RepID=UPI003DA5975D
MKCIIPGNNVKVFGRAIHSLSKIGEELYLEPLETGLSVRTVNSSRSAYACFFFSPTFFHHYNDGNNENSDEIFKCKFTMKSCLTVFRSLSTIEKSVDRCKIVLDSAENRMVFQLYCHHGIVKTHNLTYIECESLEAVFSKDRSKNVLTAQSKLLGEVVASFQTSQEEITLSINPEKVTFRNYVDDELVIHTEMNLVPEEFESFQVGLDTSITYCLKEFRAILSFSEIGNLPLSLHFEAAGRPVVFTIDSDQTFEANFVLATLAESRNNNNNSSASTSISRTQSVKKINRSTATPANKLKSMSHAAGTSSVSKPARRSLLPNNETPLVNKPSTSTSKPSYSKKPVDTGLNSRPVDTGNGDNNDKEIESLMNDALCDWDAIETDVLKSAGDATKHRRLLPVNDMSDSDEELIPGTPPPKKFKSLFSGWSLNGEEDEEAIINKPTTVLVENTDDEDDDES